MDCRTRSGARAELENAEFKKLLAETMPGKMPVRFLASGSSRPKRRASVTPAAGSP
jgi:hypothetical protein